MDLRKKILGRAEFVEENFCLRWRGSKTAKGYGKIKVKSKTRQAHRLAYVIFRDGV